MNLYVFSENTSRAGRIAGWMTPAEAEEDYGADVWPVYEAECGEDFEAHCKGLLETHRSQPPSPHSLYAARCYRNALEYGVTA